jgi:four helix bundle protein
MMDTDAGDRRPLLRSHEDLDTYRLAFSSAMRIFELSKAFPPEERYSLTDQMRRSSRSVCANLAEAWRKRRYRPAFVAKLSDAEAEAAETMTWIRFARACDYIGDDATTALADRYDRINGMLVNMIRRPDAWLLK